MLYQKRYKQKYVKIKRREKEKLAIKKTPFSRSLLNTDPFKLFFLLQLCIQHKEEL